MKMLTIFLIAYLILTTSCQTADRQIKKIDEELMVAVPLSELYIRVRGNPNGALILNLHGGPGGYSGIDIQLMGPWLEEDYLLAYLDQRGCGKSPGCTDTSMLTVEQYVQDLDIVMDSVLHGFGKNALHLRGTSWGGRDGCR